MAQIRDTIEVLTNVLRENGASKFKAEVFRQAKFNKAEATAPLWKLLFELIYYCTYGKIDDIAVQAANQLTIEEMVVYVKRELQQRGFHSKKFATLPTDMSGGSRELLLAFGWLFCREGILDRFMNHCSAPIEEGTKELYQTRKCMSDSSLVCPLSLTDPVSPSAKVQQLLLLNGKLRMNLRSLYALQDQKYRTMHKIHKATKGVSISPHRDHLSAFEVQLLKNPEVLQRVLHLLEKDNTRLQNLLRWQSQEEIFWKWMESVLDLKIRELKDDDHQVSTHSVYNIPPDGVAQLLEARRELQKTILKYESMVEQLELLWERKRSSISERELDSLIASLDMEISLQKARLALCCPTPSPEPTRPLDLCYVTSPSKKASNIRPSLPQGDLTLTEIDGRAEDILIKIASLEDNMHTLEKSIEQQQSEGKARLESLADDLPDLICIPPIGYREYV